MSKHNIRRGWLNFLVAAQKRLIMAKKAGHALVKTGRPYLAPKYWAIYLLAFALGFYLWGPARGIERVRAWKPAFPERSEKPTVETLQQEIDRLKRELKLQAQKEPGTPFNPSSFSRPALGRVIQAYEWTMVDNSWRLHSGVDIGVPAGSNVMAAAEGTVSAVAKTGVGYSVTVSHGNDWESIYSNLGTVSAQEGQKVIKGVVLGTSGPAGCKAGEPSFHFGLYHDKQPVDPARIIEGLE